MEAAADAALTRTPAAPVKVTPWLWAGALAVATVGTALWLAAHAGPFRLVPAHRSAWPQSKAEVLQRLKKFEPWRIPPHAQWSSRTGSRGVTTSTIRLRALPGRPADEALIVRTAGSVSSVAIAGPRADGASAWVSARDVLALTKPEMDRSAASTFASTLFTTKTDAAGDASPLTIGATRYVKRVRPLQVTFTAEPTPTRAS